MVSATSVEVTVLFACLLANPQQAVGNVVQYIDGQPASMNENFVPLAIEALQATWPSKH